ncbi:hypothetical protein PVAND_004666 [Polypedilum vanderplanki]|uniref:Cuticle protein n=1 Tax=Polypedilum vanderplanki TaxID=319348 RepID=A0A9J6BY90_POLVA|nr:hypothetical protein PVAND_004666 [Polypedilum vanderplanki]
MFRFAVLFALATVCSAGYFPYSYQYVNLHPTQEEWKAPTVVEWKNPIISEWKPTAHIVEWKKPEVVESKPTEKIEEWKPATYDFKYEVHDEHTKDIKRHSESSDHGAVKGQYSLIDSDGFRRVVDYTADAHHGFQATVKREPTDIKIPVPAKKWTESW